MIVIPFCLTYLIVSTLAAPHSSDVNVENLLDSDNSNVTLTEDVMGHQNKTIDLNVELENQSQNAENKSLVKRHYCNTCGGGYGGGYGGGKILVVPVVVVPVKTGGCYSKWCGYQRSSCGHGGCGGGCGSGCGGGGGGGAYAYASASAHSFSYGRK
ncbi:hypothetical protein O3M35_009710 [Rhynocoris fuscipes]|uniref:Uncharacterized protein n=1 Tax=Rhynocoris fuscipes TaxID=488301 RepID=A0AAW1D7I6_9HEMI